MFVGVLDIVITAAVQAIKIQTRASFVRELENVLIVREQVESGSTSTELILVLGFLH